MSIWVDEPVLFALGNLPPEDVPPVDGIDPAWQRSKALPLPELSEPRLVRHYYRLSTRNMAIDQGLYPLGSCTMKYNPRLNERLAAMPGLVDLHPRQPENEIQGMLALLYETEGWLSRITGLPGISLHPAAGAHGEFVGMQMVAAWHEARHTGKNKVLVPASAHGTNPKSAVMAGFDIVNVPASSAGIIRFKDLEPHLDDSVAAIMITNPNTLGVFESDMPRIADWMHAHDALVYFDGANLNAIMGRARPGDLGADVLQFNLHKTFATPHGGGGPGSGPIAVSDTLLPYLPVPRIVKQKDGSFLHSEHFADSIGRVKGFYGHTLVVLRALGYMMRLGGEGLKAATDRAVLNANYIRSRLKDRLSLAVDQDMLHEAVFSDSALEHLDVSTMDIAKALLEKGFHPPTVYFPLIVHGAMMIEPTETEDRAEMDRFVDALCEILDQAAQGESLHDRPRNTWRKRLDEVSAARKPRLVWQDDSG